MTGSNTFSVSVSQSGLAMGANVGAVTLTSSDGQIQTVIVTLTISSNLVISPASIAFQYTLGDPAPSATLSLADGTSSATAFTAYAQGYVTVTPTSGTLPATIQFSANLNFAGSYTSNISIYTGGKNYTVPVKLVVTGVPVSVAAITSDADFTPGPASPGELVVLWGSGLGPATLTPFTPTPTGAVPPRLAGATVSFNSTILRLRSFIPQKDPYA